MSNKEFAQAIKRLQRLGVVIAVEPTKRHWRLTLANGRIYTAASTPSDYRAVQNMVAGIQRMNRLQAFKPQATLQALHVAVLKRNGA